jgi:hypothetical protein
VRNDRRFHRDSAVAAVQPVRAEIKVGHSIVSKEFRGGQPRRPAGQPFRAVARA